MTDHEIESDCLEAVREGLGEQAVDALRGLVSTFGGLGAQAAVDALECVGLTPNDEQVIRGACNALWREIWPERLKARQAAEQPA